MPYETKLRKKGSSKKQTIVSKAVPTNFVLNSVSIGNSLEATKLPAESVNQVNVEYYIDTSSELSSFAQIFFLQQQKN